MKTDTLEPNTGAAKTAGLHSDCAPENHPGCARVERILVPLDLSDESMHGLQYAIPLARQFGAKLTLLHVLSPPICMSDFPYPGPGGEDCFDAIEGLLNDIRAREIPPGIESETMVRQAFVVDGILDAARETNADMIVLSAGHPYKFKHLFSRTVPEIISRRAGCRVVVAGPGDGV